MKSGTTNVVLTYVLAVLVLAGVYFDLRTVFAQRQLRTLQAQTIACQSNMQHLNLLLNEAVVYGKTHPDINRVIEPFEVKPPAH